MFAVGTPVGCNQTNGLRVFLRSLKRAQAPLILGKELVCTRLEVGVDIPSVVKGDLTSELVDLNTLVFPLIYLVAEKNCYSVPEGPNVTRDAETVAIHYLRCTGPMAGLCVFVGLFIHLLSWYQTTNKICICQCVPMTGLPRV